MSHICQGGEQTPFIRVWKLSPRRVLKPLEGKPERESPKRIIYLLAVDLGSYKWYQSQTPDDVPAFSLLPEGGQTRGGALVRMLGLKGGWIDIGRCASILAVLDMRRCASKDARSQREVDRHRTMCQPSRCSPNGRQTRGSAPVRTPSRRVDLAGVSHQLEKKTSDNKDARPKRVVLLVSVSCNLYRYNICLCFIWGNRFEAKI